MDCTQVEELALEFLYKELDSATRASFVEHARDCTRCKRVVARLKATRSVMRRLPERNPPEEGVQELLAEAEISAAGWGGAAETRADEAASSKPAVLEVFVFRGDDFIGTEVFTDAKVIVGRDPAGADLVLESNQVSRQHAEITHDGTTIRVRDLGSTNGIYIADKKVQQAEVTRRDVIVIGDHSLKLKSVLKQKVAAGSPMATQAVDAVEGHETITKIDAEAPPKPKKAPAKKGGLFDDDLSDWDDISSSLDARAHMGLSKPVAADVTLDDVSGETDIRAIRDEAEKQPEPFDRRRDSIDEMEPQEAVFDDDDDDDDDDYVPPYSLVRQLLKEDAIVARGGTQRGKPYIEVLTLRGDSVSDVTLLRPGQSFWIGRKIGFIRRRRARDLAPRMRLLKFKRNGACRVEVRKKTEGSLQRGKKRITLDLVPDANLDRRRGTVVMDIKRGEILDLTDGGNTYHVRYVEPPRRMRDPQSTLGRLRPSALMTKAFGGSATSHIVILLVASLFATQDIVQATSGPTDEFVDVTIEADVQLEEPEPEKQPEPEPEPEQAAHEKVPPKMQAAPSKRRRIRHGGSSKAPPGVLGLLSKKGSSAVPGPAAAVAAVSNLSAAKVPGARSGYRVSGLIGKLPTSSLSVGGGGGGLMTKGGAALLRGGGGGAGRLSGKGTRRVGGLVQKNPRALKPRGQGHLDRDEIQKVINANIGQIQRCYERELLKTPGLSGKLQVEWTIATSGAVRIARQTFTSMRSTSVSNCIMGAIRRWRFPRPRGGEVIVTYPFIFKSIGF